MVFVSHTLPPRMREPAQEYLLGTHQADLPTPGALDAWLAEQRVAYETRGWSRRPDRKPGVWAGQVRLAADFDEELEDFDIAL